MNSGRNLPSDRSTVQAVRSNQIPVFLPCDFFGHMIQTNPCFSYCVVVGCACNTLSLDAILVILTLND